MTNKEWFKKAQYGMMVHFGLYSVLCGEWQGKRMGCTIGEWAQAYFRIPNKEYEKLATVFNPIYFNADEWVDIAIDAGMRYLVVTAKHYEGFALFHSKADKFNVVDATYPPCGKRRDFKGDLRGGSGSFGGFGEEVRNKKQASRRI